MDKVRKPNISVSYCCLLKQSLFVVTIIRNTQRHSVGRMQSSIIYKQLVHIVLKTLNYIFKWWFIAFCFLNYFTTETVQYCGPQFDLQRCSIFPLRQPSPCMSVEAPWHSQWPHGWERRYQSLPVSQLGRFSLTGTQPPPPPRQTQVIDMVTDKARKCLRWALSFCLPVTRQLSPSVSTEWLSRGLSVASKPREWVNLCLRSESGRRTIIWSLDRLILKSKYNFTCCVFTGAKHGLSFYLFAACGVVSVIYIVWSQDD
jgi:hypothetical protein